MTVFPPCSYRKCSSVLPCLIGMNTFGFQHSQISLSCLAELTVALHLLSGNTRSDSPFLNTDAKMERTEEIVSKTVHERETDLSIHCCHFSIWQKDFGWLFFLRGERQLTTVTPTLHELIPPTPFGSLQQKLDVFHCYFSGQLQQYLQGLKIFLNSDCQYMQYKKTQLLSRENQSQKQCESKIAKGSGRGSQEE